ncbi:MAG: ATP synthase F1 subunit delta [Candidatus Woykebacteria bacterium RBG_13_40_7b]|uniref:ATP synthase F1 subunit delta n=1 Tax=Candidatus Woykebacteria bacterium RBG_13_40_7b TaxID=1802594 RepID=A0A1G1W930_9BACT|nr:MAG: ATP synthase F1 subunit delta [Candidatus Woykebacteria bacterium RBG_13_40_7b]
MNISKDELKIAKLSFKASLTGDKIDPRKVGDVTRLLLKQKPKGLLSVFKGYVKLLRNKYKYQTAFVESAINLPKSDLAQILRNLSKSFKSDLNLESKINPDLLAGIKIKIGDTVLDYSIAGQLQNLRTSLVEARREDFL